MLRDGRKSASAKSERTSNSEVSKGPTALLHAVRGRDKTAVQKIIRLNPEWVCVIFFLYSNNNDFILSLWNFPLQDLGQDILEVEFERNYSDPTK